MRKLLAAAVIAALVPSAALAGTFQGKVYWLHVMSDGYMIVHTTGPITNAVCSNNYRYVFDTTTALGKSRLATLLTAYTLGLEIYFLGTGTCPAHGGEGIDYFTTVGGP